MAEETPADIFMREHGGKSPTACRALSSAAPDAWITALERNGTMSFGDVASYSPSAPPRDGLRGESAAGGTLAAHTHEYRALATNTAIYLPGGHVPKSGDEFVQSDLARTMQYMADQEGAAAGPEREAGLAAAHDAFYRGDIAAEIVPLPARRGRIALGGGPRRVSVAHRAGGSRTAGAGTR